MRSASPRLAAQFLVLAWITLVAAGCVSTQATTYEAEFDPPRTYIDFMGARLPETAISKRMIAKGIAFAGGLGYDVEFVAAVNSQGCEDICFLYRQRYVDDVYVVLTASESQARFRRWFHFSPLDSGSP